MTLTAQIVSFVNGTDLFYGNPKAWDAFVESDPDCSWGNNNRTLVSSTFMQTVLSELDADDDDDDADEQIQKVLELVKTLPADVYIDLEN